MRLKGQTDGLEHSALTNVTQSDHHPRPATVSISNTTQSLPPGTTYDLDVTLPNANYVRAKVLLTGYDTAGGAALQRECAEIVVTTDSDEAIAYSVRNSAFKQVYVATYSKQNGDTNLTHKIFDSTSGTTNRYIALMDAWISGATLRLRFKNYFGGSATLWVKGSAEVY